MDTPDMKYRIILNDGDYLRFKIFHTYHSKLGKRQINKMRTMMIKLYGCVFLLFLSVEVSHYVLILYVIIAAVISVIYYFNTPKRLERSILKQVSEMKEDGKLPYHADAEIEFMESMIVHRCEQGEIHVNYRDIERIYIEQDYLYIYYNAVQAFAIPYHCLGEDKDRVIEYVTEKRICLE